MYKKLNLSFLTLTFIFLILSFINSCVFGQIPVSNSILFNSTLDSINTFFSTTFFDLETINTEILARRIGSGLATAGLGGVGTGIGLVFSGLIKGFSRNPSLKDDLFSYAIFGFALTEAIGLFALMMAFMLLYA